MKSNTIAAFRAQEIAENIKKEELERTKRLRDGLSQIYTTWVENRNKCQRVTHGFEDTVLFIADYQLAIGWPAAVESAARSEFMEKAAADGFHVEANDKKIIITNEELYEFHSQRQQDLHRESIDEECDVMARRWGVTQGCQLVNDTGVEIPVATMTGHCIIN